MAFYPVVLRLDDLKYHTERVYAESADQAGVEALHRAPRTDSGGGPPRVITVIPRPAIDPASPDPALHV